MNGGDAEGCDSDRIWDSSPIFVWRQWGKPRRMSVGILNVRAEVRTEDLPNRNLDGDRFTNSLGVQLYKQRLLNQIFSWYNVVLSLSHWENRNEETQKVVKWLGLALSNVLNKVFPTPSPEDGNRSGSWNVVFFRIPDDGQGPKTLYSRVS
jgi:hypothetical protein